MHMAKIESTFFISDPLYINNDNMKYIYIKVNIDLHHKLVYDKKI